MKPPFKAAPKPAVTVKPGAPKAFNKSAQMAKADALRKGKACPPGGEMDE